MFGVIAAADTIENALLKAFYVEDVAKIEAISRTL
jgi:ribulose-5-phosphate 4-epimerase/fuculose-1-phosphate aldolase